MKDLTDEQEALQRFELLFRNNPSLIALFSHTGGQILDVNNAFLNTLGYRMEEVIGKTILEIGLFDDDSTVNFVLDQLNSKLLVNNMEMTIRDRSGNTRRGLLTAEILEGKGKNIFWEYWSISQNNMPIARRCRCSWIWQSLLSKCLLKR